MTRPGTALLVVDGLHSLSDLPAVLDAVPAERPRPVALSREAVLEKLQAWEADYAGAQAPATLKALRSDWNRYLAWCEGTGTVPLPLSVDGLVAYVHNAIERGLKRKTIDRYLFSLGTVHDAAELPNPVKHPRFRLKFKAAIKRLVADDRNEPTPAEALSRDDVEQILAGLDLDRMVPLRNAALLSLAADTMCRESELVRVRLESFDRQRVSGQVTLDVGPSKANPEGRPDPRYVSPESWALVQRWCARARITTGVVFVAIAGRKKATMPVKHSVGVPQLAEQPPTNAAERRGMNPKEVARIFKTLARDAGLGQRALRVSGHSTRIGSANDLACAGEDVRAIAAAGGWKDLKQVMHYTQGSRAGLGAMARLRDQRIAGTDQTPAARPARPRSALAPREKPMTALPPQDVPLLLLDAVAGVTLPGGISASIQELEDGRWAWVLQHVRLGFLGRVVIRRERGGMRASTEVAGELGDGMTRDRHAALAPLAEAVLQRLGADRSSQPFDPQGVRKEPGREIAVQHVPCPRCKAVVAFLIHAERATTVGHLEDYARQLHSEIVRLNVPTWVLGPDLGDGPMMDRPADMLKVWPQRQPVKRQRPADLDVELGPMIANHRCGTQQ